MGWADDPIIAPPSAGGGAWRNDPVTTQAPPSDAQRQWDLDRAYEAEALTPPPADGPLPPRMAMPEGYRDRNVAPQTGAAPSANDPVRGLQRGTQAVGAGLAGIAGLPVDLGEIIGNIGLWGADKVSGGQVPFRFQDSFGGSNSIRSGTAAGARTLLGEDAVIDQEDMTPDERVMYLAQQFATEGAVGSGLISKFRDVLPRALTAPFEAAGRDGRVLAGDAAAGGGAGALMGAYDEYAPEGVKDALGPVGNILAGLAGGVGGAKLANVGEGVAGAATGAVNKRRYLPEEIIPRDPDTMLPVRHSDAERAATLMQEKAWNPQAASAEITKYLDEIGPGPKPTTALMSGDTGLLSAERQMRTTLPAPFMDADRRVMDSASDTIGGLRPAGADPQAPRAAAQQINDDMMAAARGQVSGAESRVAAQNAEAEMLAANLSTGRSADQASRDLDRVIVDETYLPARDRKNQLYDRAAEDPNVVVRTENVRRRADDALTRTEQANPALRDPSSERIAEAFTRPRQPEAQNPDGLPSVDTAPEPPVTRTLAQAMEDRRALSGIQSEARAKGDFGRADTAGDLRKGINEDIDTAAKSGVPGTEKLATADSNYREQFAPYFRDGSVSPEFFKTIDRDPGRTKALPESTAGKFLTAGPTGRAAAEDVSKILSIAPDPAEGMAAATDYVIADAVGKGVIRDGKISETGLAAFIAKREGMFSQLPEVKKRFDALLSDVRAGNAKSGELAAQLKEAASAAKLTERQVNSGVLKLIADAEPRKAVQGVFAAKDSVKAMRDATAAFKDNPAAAEGWKASVADYLTEQATTASKAAVSGDKDTVSLPKLTSLLDKNRAALSEVFSPEEMSSLTQVQKRLEVMSKRGAAASTGSATAENFGGMRGVLRMFAEPVGNIVMITRGALMAGSVERRVKMIADQFPDADAAASKLLLRAQFDPELAKHLLDFPTSDAQVYEWSRGLNRLLVLGGAEQEKEAE